MWPAASLAIAIAAMRSRPLSKPTRAWVSRFLNREIALRRIEATRVSSALSITRFCSPLESNGSLNLERRSAYALRDESIGLCENPSEINADE
jgi:hypothetical protein